MTDKAKFYKLALNLLDHHASIKFIYDHDKEKYIATILSFDYAECSIELGLDTGPYMIWVIFKDRNKDKTYRAFQLEDLDNVLDGMRDSYIDFLLKGIE